MLTGAGPRGYGAGGCWVLLQVWELGHPAHRAAIHPHLARRRAVQAADDVQQRGLAGARSPAQGSELAPAYRERHPPQGVHGRMPAAEGPGNTIRRHHDLRRLASIRCAVRGGERGVVWAHTRKPASDRKRLPRPGKILPAPVPAGQDGGESKSVRQAKLFVFLRQHRHELFDEEFRT